MTNIPKKEPKRNHGSPYDRGSADRYYGRNFDPHWWPDGTGKGLKITAELMHEDELEEYALGWWQEENRKEWN